MESTIIVCKLIDMEKKEIQYTHNCWRIIWKKMDQLKLGSNIRNENTTEMRKKT